jgi:hypothetical protein
MPLDSGSLLLKSSEYSTLDVEHFTDTIQTTCCRNSMKDVENMVVGVNIYSVVNKIRLGDTPLFRGQAASLREHKQDARKFVEISYVQIGLSIADMTVV